MKRLILLLSICAIAGCSTIGSVRRGIFGDPSISAQQKTDYALELERLHARTKEFKIYHFLALGLIAVGGFITFVSKTNTVLGVGAMVTGGIVSAWAMYAPTNPKFVFGLLVIAIALGVFYVINSMWAKRHKHETVDSIV